MFYNNINLKQYNTFGIAATARCFASFSTIDQLQECLEFKPAKTSTDQQPALIIGGGSNILFTEDYNGLVIKNDMPGIEIVQEDDEHVYVKAGAGVNWHHLVLYAIAGNLAGMENLSLIPGNTGASPMQNIGAYGVEIKDIFHTLQAWHIADKKLVHFNKADCEFGYRESIFKGSYRNQFVIINVTFRLNKKPTFNIDYGAIQQELESMGITDLSIAAVSQAVINIRRSKLPDPTITGNAGSFFKNPVINKKDFLLLKEKFATIVGYDLPGESVKLAAGWLIEQAGWKGYRKGDAGCHAKQALVLVNYGKASGKEILALSRDIIGSVQQKFGVTLEREVNII